MSDTKYSYSISDDFPNGKVDSDRLTYEINGSSIITALFRVDIFSDQDTCEIWFKSALSAEDQATLDTIVANHSGEPMQTPEPELDSEGRMVVVPSPEKDKAMIIIATHDFCDPTTWFQQSERVFSEILTEESGNVFSGSHQYWIDLTHGKYYQEDRIEDVEQNYGVVVTVDGVGKTPRPPFHGDGGDYFVNYHDGKVHFNESQAGKTVRATYSYANGSLFSLVPAEGKILWVLSSEVQFAANVIVNDTVNFQGWAYNPQNPPEKIPVTQITKYKTIRDFVCEARGCYPVIPKIGGQYRGLQQDHVTFPFNYLQLKELRSSLGLEIRVWLENDEDFDGEFGTATFYCVSYDES